MPRGDASLLAKRHLCASAHARTFTSNFERLRASPKSVGPSLHFAACFYACMTMVINAPPRSTATSAIVLHQRLRSRPLYGSGLKSEHRPWERNKNPGLDGKGLKVRPRCRIP